MVNHKSYMTYFSSLNFVNTPSPSSIRIQLVRCLEKILECSLNANLFHYIMRMNKMLYSQINSHYILAIRSQLIQPNFQEMKQKKLILKALIKCTKCKVTTHMKFSLQIYVGLDLILSHSLYSEREIRLKQISPPEGECVLTHSQYR